MVQPKSKKIWYFVSFILPCLVLYLLFFIYPFLNGFFVSLTNWDGLTPRVPNIISNQEFETDLMDKLKKDKDKEYLKKFYTYDASSDQWTRKNLSGFETMKLTFIMNKVDYYPANNKPVGLKNYIDIFTGKVKNDFYPRFIDMVYHNKDSDNLPIRIPSDDYEKLIKPKLTPEQVSEFNYYYTFEPVEKKAGNYVFNTEYSITAVKRAIRELPESSAGTFTISMRDVFLRNVKEAVISDNIGVIDGYVSDLAESASLSDSSTAVIENIADDLIRYYKVSCFISDTWVEKAFRMGVIGFTIFFAFFSVIGINVLAFLLALALDTGIKGNKILRTIFFLPNVLSMIIVALIWSSIFSILLPKITGIDLWLSDPKKTPWLLVLIAVWQGCGYYMIVYLAGLQNIPTDVIEAAYIDGVTMWQQFKYITLPLILPAVTISLFLSIANALKTFDLMYAIIGPTGRSTGTIPYVYDIYFDAFAQKQAGLATAKAMLLFVVIFAVTGLQLFLMKRKEVEQ